MHRADVNALLNKKIRARDGMLVGTITGLEADFIVTGPEDGVEFRRF